MGKIWKNLRGDELIAFAASASDCNGAFVHHLARYAPEADFFNFIDKHAISINECWNAVCFNPLLTKSWLTKILSNIASASSVYTIDETLSTFGGMMRSSVRNICSEVFVTTDFSAMPVAFNTGLFPVLLHSQMHEIVEKHWSVFEKVVKKNVAKNVVLAAENGMDLQQRFSWAPKNDKQKDAYFVACCRGGLIDRVVDLNCDANKTSVLLEAMEYSVTKRLDKIVNHLLDTYPNTPWHTCSSILSSAAILPPYVAEKIFNHFQQHDPVYFEKKVVDLACACVPLLYTQHFYCVAPYVPEAQHHRILKTTIRHRKKKIMKNVLKMGSGEQEFIKALDGLFQKDLDWANTVYNETQKKRLSKELKTLKAPVVQRKM